MKGEAGMGVGLCLAPKEQTHPQPRAIMAWESVRFHQRNREKDVITEINKTTIESLQTENGGWTKESLAKLGISWPPTEGWKKFLESKSHVVPEYDKSRYPKYIKKGICRGCGDIVPRGRITWCSNHCFERHDPNTVKRRTFKRDNHTCQLCGINFDKALDDWRKSEPKNWKTYSEWTTWRKAKPKWCFDHIKPFSEGGATVVENMRTLCVPCHKKVTKEWHKTRSGRKQKGQLNGAEGFTMLGDSDIK